jgi:hypothetical protein
MAIIHVTEATVGAPNGGRISGTAGDLYAMLKYAAPLNGWAVEYDDAVNFRCVLRPGTGNRFRLYVNDNATDSGSAARCIIRGCENASGTLYANLTDPFPTQAQVADTSSNWVKSSAVSATARLFDIWVAETFIWVSINWGGTTNVWDLQGFGDFAPSLPGDSYNTFCTTRNTTTIGGAAAWQGANGMLPTSLNGSSSFYICRSYDGTVKSTLGGLVGRANQTSIGVVSASINGALVGPTTGIDTRKFEIFDSGSGAGTVSATLCLPVRGFMPNLLSPQHGGCGTLNARHSYPETPYMATGKVVTAASTSSFAVIQASDDWTPPA